MTMLYERDFLVISCFDYSMEFWLALEFAFDDAFHWSSCSILDQCLLDGDELFS